MGLCNLFGRVYSEVRVRVVWCCGVKKGLIGLTFYICNGKLTLGNSEHPSCKCLDPSVRGQLVKMLIILEPHGIF